MPYIKKADRVFLAETDVVPNTSGELNYIITVVVSEFLTKHGLSYKTCNDIVGALDNAKSEFKRRIQDPYEDKKILENGDVYPEEILRQIK